MNRNPWALSPYNEPEGATPEYAESLENYAEIAWLTATQKEDCLRRGRKCRAAYAAASTSWTAHRAAGFSERDSALVARIAAAAAYDTAR